MRKLNNTREHPAWSRRVGPTVRIRPSRVSDRRFCEVAPRPGDCSKIGTSLCQAAADREETKTQFGVERGRYEVSARIAETALLPAVRDRSADEVVLADGFCCRTQLEELAATRGRHLAELLAEHL